MSISQLEGTNVKILIILPNDTLGGAEKILMIISQEFSNKHHKVRI